MINIVCVYQITEYSFVKYTPEYVQKLKRSFAKHLTVPHRFVCLTNLDYIEGVETHKLLFPNWWGHWAKMEIFRPGLLTGPTIYSDLDALLCGNIDALAEAKDYHVMIEDFYPEIYNSTLMYFNSSDIIYTQLYNDMVNNEAAIKEKYAWKRRGVTYGDQALIYDYVKEHNKPITKWQEFLPREWFLKFSGVTGIRPAARKWDENSPARYVYCMGPPKFHDIPDLPLVQQHWI